MDKSILEQACSENELKDFKQRAMNLIQQANQHYTNQAKSYSKTVQKKIQKELVA